MSNQPSGINTALERVRQFSSAVTDCAERENAIESDLRLRTARAKRVYEEALSDLDTLHKGKLAEAQSNLHNDTERANDLYKNRESRIERAYSNALNQSSDSLETERGRKISAVQAKTLEAKRKKENELSEAKKTQTEIDNILSNHINEFKSLRKRILASFRGFPFLCRKLKNQTVNKDNNNSYQDEALDLPKICKDIGETINSAKKDLAGFESNIIPKIFRFLPLQWRALRHAVIHDVQRPDPYLRDDGRAELRPRQFLHAGRLLCLYRWPRHRFLDRVADCPHPGGRPWRPGRALRAPARP